MNQTTKMWMDSNAIMERLLKAIEGATKPDMEVVAASQRMFEGQIKLLNAHVAMFQTKSKNERSIKHWEKMNLIGDSAIDLMLGNPEADKIKCHEKDTLISRAECLDYSGSHLDDCDGCYNFGPTRKKLLGHNEGQ